MRLLPSLALFATLASSAAYAGTVKLDSTGNGSITYGTTLGTTAGTAVAYQYSGYASPIAGSAWISSSNVGGTGATGDTYYTETFNLQSNESYSGTISFYDDNSAGIYIDGVNVLTNPDNPNGGDFVTGTMQTFNLTSSMFRAGANTITFDIYNGTGPQAVDYAATLIGTAITPEPSSLVLLGTGALGMVGAVRRRIQS